MRKPQLELISDQPESLEDKFDTVEMTDYSDEPTSNSRRDKVIKALNLLSQHQQKLLDLKFQKNLSNKEIANEMGITIQSVYNAVFKALRSIRKQLPSFSVVAFLIS